MKFVIILALIAFVAADVAHLKPEYLPPNQDAPAEKAAEPAPLDASASLESRSAAVDLAAAPEQEAAAAQGEPAAAKSEPEPAHSLNDDGYKYKSPV